MARDEVTVLLPTADDSFSIESGAITKQAVTVANGIKIKDAFKNKNNSLQITIENSYTTANSTLTIKAGDQYPNAVIGDLAVTLTKPSSGTNLVVVEIEDEARFENRDGSIYLDFSTNFTGNVWAVAKRAGVKPLS